MGVTTGNTRNDGSGDCGGFGAEHLFPRAFPPVSSMSVRLW